MGKKNIDLAQLQESVQKINSAVEDFQPYSKKFVGEIIVLFVKLNTTSFFKLFSLNSRCLSGC